MAQARIGRTPDLERIMDQSMTNDFALYLGRFGQMYACRPATHSALPVPCSAPLLGAPLILCAVSVHRYLQAYATIPVPSNPHPVYVGNWYNETADPEHKGKKSVKIFRTLDRAHCLKHGAYYYASKAHCVHHVQLDRMWVALVRARALMDLHHTLHQSPPRLDYGYTRR